MNNNQLNGQSRTRREFGETFKRNAVNLTLRGDRSTLPQIARELGVGDSHLYQWRRQFAPGPSRASAVKQEQTAEQKDELIAWQAAEITRLREREIILKKSLGILSETPERGLPGSRR
jgi:transposase-like protein